jgi:hypothetical protein
MIARCSLIQPDLIDAPCTLYNALRGVIKISTSLVAHNSLRF